MQAPDPNELLNIADKVVTQAMRDGADVAEAIVSQGTELSAQTRMQNPERLEQGSSKGLGLRLFVGERSGNVSTSDLSDAGLKKAIADAMELASFVEPDPLALPPDASLQGALPDIDLDQFDVHVLEMRGNEALQRAQQAEKAALMYDTRLQHSDGASFGCNVGASALVTSQGFRGSRQGSVTSMSVRPVVDDSDNKKRRSYDWDASRTLSKLKSPEDVGREAAKRTLARLGSRKVKTQKAPVVFPPETARSILGLFVSCVTGGAIWRSSSYLKEREGTKVASEFVNICDDPLIPGAMGSRLYDGEGLPSRRNVVVEDGVLKSFLLDTYSARKLDKQSTASASRGGAGGVGPSCSNVVLGESELSAEELRADIGQGLYVTDMMGYGFNPVTGDFSRGAAGFWIENGELTFPVSEVTISLNLDTLMQSITRVGGDIDRRSAIMTPSILVSEMTIAGES